MQKSPRGGNTCVACVGSNTLATPSSVLMQKSPRGGNTCVACVGSNTLATPSSVLMQKAPSRAMRFSVNRMCCDVVCVCVCCSVWAVAHQTAIRACRRHSVDSDPIKRISHGASGHLTLPASNHASRLHPPHFSIVNKRLSLSLSLSLSLRTSYPHLDYSVQRWIPPPRLGSVCSGHRRRGGEPH
jgi:hypothetical protein